MTETKTVQVGPGFFGLLTLLFIALKLTDVIDWSWLWVLAPLWVGPAILLAGGAVVLVVVGITSAVMFLFNRKRYRQDKNIRKARRALNSYGNGLTRR